MSSPFPIEAVTLDLFNTLIFHKEGRGRGKVLVDYVRAHGFEPLPWEHQILYDIFEHHETAYSPGASSGAKTEYRLELARRVFERLGVPASDDQVEYHRDSLWEILGPSAFEVFEDAWPALRALRSGGVPTAIVSNWQPGVRHFCAELGIEDLVDHVVGSADVGVAKPDPRIFLEACRRLGVVPERALHVGDAVVDDCEGGRAAGLQVVLIHRGQLLPSTPCRVIADLSELESIVL